ncbi:MAG: hypothetical protein OEX81_00905 [Candidatus Pacebacteria bacterium]|nr:hypothetical protein [Candidatus Paceibacterota bacterium]
MKDKKSSSNKNLIMRIYLFFFMGVGLIMMVIGTYGLGQNFYKSKLLPKYPLGGYEQRCDYLEGSPRAMPIGKPGVMIEDVELSEEVIEKNKKAVADCEANLAEERQTRKVTDLYNSLITFSIGFVLFSSHLIVNIKVGSKS